MGLKSMWVADCETVYQRAWIELLLHTRIMHIWWFHSKFALNSCCIVIIQKCNLKNSSFRPIRVWRLYAGWPHHYLISMKCLSHNISYVYARKCHRPDYFNDIPYTKFNDSFCGYTQLFVLKYDWHFTYFDVCRLTELMGLVCLAFGRST